MKNSGRCPKCEKTNLIIIPRNTDELGFANSINVGAWKKRVNVALYICADCGFLEKWINSEQDLAAIANKYLP